MRPITLGDAPAVQKYFNDWNIIKHMSVKVPWPYPDDGALTHIRDDVLPKMGTGEWLVWAITLKGGNDEAIGMINFRTIEMEDGHRGFWLAKSYQGQGFMTEAVYAVNDFVFNVLGLDYFHVHNAKDNGASRRIKEKTGAIFLSEISAPHHSGDTAEIWKVTRESWDDMI